jgi:hypothetical protein
VVIAGKILFGGGGFFRASSSLTFISSSINDRSRTNVSRFGGSSEIIVLLDAFHWTAALSLLLSSNASFVKPCCESCPTIPMFEVVEDPKLISPRYESGSDGSDDGEHVLLSSGALFRVSLHLAIFTANERAAVESQRRVGRSRRGSVVEIEGRPRSFSSSKNGKAGNSSSDLLHTLLKGFLNNMILSLMHSVDR